MRLENPRSFERLGLVKINEVQRVIQFDSGKKSSAERSLLAVRRIDKEQIQSIQEKMAIVLPIKNENIRLLEGILSAIPHNCSIIIVSNSQRVKPDRFKAEHEVLKRFCEFTQQKAYIIHQKDEQFAKALRETGYTEILDENGLVRDGKCEGMIIGILMAKLLGKEYIGFVDTDNFIPGSVWEYITSFAAGFSMASTPYAMVRILWKYKHHIRGESKFFRRWGRVSLINNQFLNSLIGRATGFESDIIQTSCAGEHAITLKLAEILPFASGYAVETYELVYILENFGKQDAAVDSDIAHHGIEIFQIETRNPHVHEFRNQESHLLQEMLLPSLSSIYHSSLCDQSLKEKILRVLISEGCLNPGEEPPPPRIYPPISVMDSEHFAEILKSRFHLYSSTGRKRS